MGMEEYKTADGDVDMRLDSEVQEHTEKYRPIKHFTDLEAWKLARQLRIALYEITKSLPSEERYDLGSQMRRAGISGTSNIAEGYGRFHFQENIQFCRISRGSIYESQDHLITCLDNGYIEESHFNEVWKISDNSVKVLDGYIRYLRKQMDRKRK